MKLEKLVQFSFLLCLCLTLNACQSTKADAAAIEEETYETLTWPSEGLAAMIEAPSSGTGTIYTNTENKFTAYVADVEKADYEEYIASCEAQGFDLDEWTIEGRFRGYNEDGYKVVLSWDNDDFVMRIDILVPDEKKGSVTIENSRLDIDLTMDLDDFSAMLDEYETFYTDYCNFMKSYDEQEADEAKKEEYSSYESGRIQKKSELDSLGTLDLNDEQRSLYEKSLTRIEKLLKLAQAE